jgi:uncharacterized RDD family membrane protein YckC
MTNIKQQKQTSEVPVYAGFWIRVLATILDSIFLLPIILVAAYFFGYDQINISSVNINTNINTGQATTALNSFSVNSATNHLVFFVAIIYSALLVSSGAQATWGKRAVGIYIANEDGSRLSTLKAAMRYLATILSSCTFGIGFILIALNKEKAALHDFICKTRVFYGRK